MNQREAFEAWQLDTGRTDPIWLDRGDGGNYGLNDVQAEWEEWQAAWQAALASQWQPIQTAPKDGTAILLWEQYSTNPFVGYWQDGGWNACLEHVEAHGGWDGAIAVGLIVMPVTHWMPLPPEPTK